MSREVQPSTESLPLHQFLILSEHGMTVNRNQSLVTGTNLKQNVVQHKIPSAINNWSLEDRKQTNADVRYISYWKEKLKYKQLI